MLGLDTQGMCCINIVGNYVEREKILKGQGGGGSFPYVPPYYNYLILSHIPIVTVVMRYEI